MKHQLFTQSEFRANRWHRLMALMLWLLMAALSQPVAAQEEIDQTKLGIRGGLIFGMDASQVDGDDYAGYHKVGFNTG